MRALWLWALGAAAVGAYLAKVAGGVIVEASDDFEEKGVIQAVMDELTRYKLPAAGQPFAEDFRFAEFYYNLPDNLLARMAQQESYFNPLAVSPAGAKGLLQFMPATWAEWGGGRDIFDPKAQISAAGRYMRYLADYFNGDYTLALAAYNFGMGNVRKGRPWPAETVNYVSQIGEDIGLVTA